LDVERSRVSVFGIRRLFPALPSSLFPHSLRPRAAFTVIELMIVMGVLSILLSILLPVFHTVRKATLKARAKIEATALAQAVVEYKNVYGYWPGMVNATGMQLQQNTSALGNSSTLNWPLVSRYSNEWFTVKTTSGDEVNYVVDNILYRSLLPFDTRNTDNLNPLNPRRIRFIDLNNESHPTETSRPDPWGNQYIIVMGLTPSSSFVQNFTRNGGGVFQTLAVSNLTAFAISLGPDGQNSTNLIFSAGVPQ
jgi:prepilin-type N-terminal cleavage/methylation domain-containing protein